jgi:ribosomal protein S2
VEKGCFRVGIVMNKFTIFKNKQVSDFLISQGYWGHKKKFLNLSLNKHIIGLKSGTAVFNSEHFLESIYRTSLFCFNLIFIGGTLFFINLNDAYKKLTIFFAVRSFQCFYTNKWFGGLITNNLLGNEVPSSFIVSSLNYNNYVLKESFRKLIPTICVEDTDNNFHKTSYSVLANDDKKDSISLFHCTLSDSIVKSLLFKFCKSLN